MSILDRPVDAIVLAGGRATRMGGLDKPALVVGGRRMLDIALDAVSACDRIVVVGPPRDDLPERVAQAQESPVRSGPVAATGAGLAALDGRDALDGRAGELVVVLASDLPTLGSRVVADLVRALADRPEADAAFAQDADGRLQFLLGVWRRSALAARIDALGDPQNRPMKALVPGNHVALPCPGIADCDTPDDIARARATRAADPLSPDEAREAVRKALTALPIHELHPCDAFGATLAAPLVAADALPRFDVSAMDGYAVAGPGPWRLRPEVRAAGGAGGIVLGDGEAVRIATGAKVPRGSTRVIRDEYVEVKLECEPRLAVRAGAPERDDTRLRGEDWQPGHHLAAPGTTVTPAVASAAASAEVETVKVRGPVRAHVVVTGDEIRRHGPLTDGQTRDTLGPVLPDMLRHCGVRTVSNIHLRDTAESFDELLSEVHDAEVIVVVGATGGGAADQLRAALDRAGARTVVGRVRCRPGGSQLTAVLPDGRVVLGLPGNPLAAVATLLLIVPAVVDGLTGRVPTTAPSGRLANAAEVGTSVTRIVPVTRQADGRWHADTSVRTAHLAGLIGRDALALVPVDPIDGQRVELLPLPG